ncbi:hypothetical protein CBFG_01122 [Clostridiales bacterium 1_7_47FAA]|nr:hypothetical protein CBFG_01122 [Clostridiales bacterium 1_7_47FAA]
MVSGTGNGPEGIGFLPARFVWAGSGWTGSGWTGSGQAGSGWTGPMAGMSAMNDICDD